jgi:nitroreductase
MELRQAIYMRRAVRHFTSDPVDRATLDRLIDAAIQAPSAVNEQSWSFAVVLDRQLLARISSESKAHMLRTPPAGFSSRHFAELQDPAFDIFYGAPALIVISSRARSRWAVEDCALAAENLMLAACDAGLGSCWIGFAQAWLETAAGKAALGLPANYLPVAPIIVGHLAAAMPPVPRKPPEVRWIGS